jgi:hypothetical protein
LNYNTTFKLENEDRPEYTRRDVTEHMILDSNVAKALFEKHDKKLEELWSTIKLQPHIDKPFSREETKNWENGRKKKLTCYELKENDMVSIEACVLLGCSASRVYAVAEKHGLKVRKAHIRAPGQSRAGDEKTIYYRDEIIALSKTNWRDKSPIPVLQKLG